MSRKSFVILIMVLGMAILQLLQITPVYAQDPTPENDENCLSCHESQYFLYDSGKYFCLCEAPMHCIYCHGGRNDSYIKEIAHIGISFYPTAENAARCKTCHEEDYMARVVKFDAVAGVGPEPRPMMTATAFPTLFGMVEPYSGAPLLRLSQLETWQQVGLTIIALFIFGILLIGYRCWKADCMNKYQL